MIWSSNNKLLCIWCLKSKDGVGTFMTGANNDQIWLPMGWMSDSEQCLNWLEFDIISLLVNFSCEMGQIMTIYDFLWARWVNLINVQPTQTWSNSILVNLSCGAKNLIRFYIALNLGGGNGFFGNPKLSRYSK